MWIPLLLACGAEVTVAGPAVTAAEPPKAAEPTKAPAATEAAATSPTVVGLAKLTVGEEVVVCSRQAPIFQAGAYACGPTTVKVLEHEVGPTVTEEALWALIGSTGLDPERPVKIMSASAGSDPDTAVTSGQVLQKPRGVAGLFGNYVYERSDGTHVVYLSQNTP